MKSTATACQGVALGLMLTVTLAAQQHVTVLRGALVHPVAEPPIENGVVVLAGGKIQLVGGPGTAIPHGATVVDCTGKVITPGLIDAATTLGVRDRDANEQGEEVTPAVHVLDAIEPTDPAFDRAVKSGVTAVEISPGNRNVIGGLGAVLKTYGETLRTMLVRDESLLHVTLGTEPSRGNRAIRGGVPNSIYYRRPTTRMGVVWALRKAWFDAGQYRQQKTDGSQLPAPDAAMEVLVRALDGNLQIRTTARAEQDIRTALRIADEFGYQTVLEDATEAWQVADELAQAGCTVVLGSPSRADDTDQAESRWNTIVLLAEKGIPFVIATGGEAEPADLVREAMFAVRNGLDADRALQAITLLPARVLGVDDRLGSLEPGKDADVVVWSGDPLSPASRPVTVYVAGEAVP